MKKKIAILGSSGSIGTQALEVIEKLGDLFEVTALAVNTQVALLEEQIKRFTPAVVSVSSPESANELAQKYKNTEVLHGNEGLAKIAKEADYDTILVCVTGIDGLIPTLEAVKRGKTVALANKETLVSAGDIVMEAVAGYNAQIIPVDSEHSAIFQCTQEQNHVKKLIITASGGPFLNKSVEETKSATRAQTLAHPRWNMGAKITVDSATLMNKGLEVIEAHHLFNKSYDDIEVVIHPQSIIHSAVEFSDGSVLAQMGVPSMHIPIQYALTYPQRVEGIKTSSLNLIDIAKLEFFAPDFEKFPALKLAYEAGKQGGTAPAVINAANETAVYAYLRDEIKLGDIISITKSVLDNTDFIGFPSFEEILEADKLARYEAEQVILKLKSHV
ncbi:MAG: 1-deoxy-D-xylulose-5-phosphate reductoisomerase [Candidatus Gastranaerophilales bacterium]|nr:1-deoxy-D-xylulose-5-phosphate reductoisomerase [Candidatus Gastranaerophilales bacterium]